MVHTWFWLSVLILLAFVFKHGTAVPVPYGDEPLFAK